MEKKSSKFNLIRDVALLMLGILLGLMFGICLTDEMVESRDKIIDELQTENLVLKEENQDIMGLWTENHR